MNTDDYTFEEMAEIIDACVSRLLAEVKWLRETYNLATCQSCTCNGDGIAGSAYEGHIIKCACMEEEK